MQLAAGWGCQELLVIVIRVKTAHLVRRQVFKLHACDPQRPETVQIVTRPSDGKGIHMLETPAHLTHSATHIFQHMHIWQ